MCHFLSGYATEKRGLRCRPFILSHEDQIEYYGDQDLDKKQPVALVRWEITPPGNWMKDGAFWDVSLWAFKIDQQEIPAWCDVKMLESDVRRLLKSLLDDCPVAGETTILDGQYIAVRGEGEIRSGGWSTVLYFPDATTIKYGGSMAVRYGGSMTVRYGGSMTVQEGGSMTVQHGGSMTVQDGGSMTVRYGGFMTVRYGWDMTVQEGGFMTVQEGGYAMIDGVQYKDGKPERDKGALEMQQPTDEARDAASERGGER